MRAFSRSLALISLLVLLAATAFGQGTTSALSGTVTTDGAGLPGVTVSVSSPALQGVRTTVTGDGGGYSFPSLPPGTYTVKFELAGMQTVSQRVELSLAQTARADAGLKVSSITEAITVTAEAPSVLQSPGISTNFDSKLIEDLPIGRTIIATTRLAPGVQTSGVGGQTVINGAQSFDNLYLVNGVTVNDQLRGQPDNLFIEDAIQETTILTSGVSAEYGRFTGGVISAITKSGGNDFSASLRDSLTNDNWTKKTVFEDPRSHVRQSNPLDKTNKVYEETLGGRIIRDRLWFFGAGRQAKLSDQRTTVGLNQSYIHGTDEKRLEGKLTGNVTSKHSLNVSYLDIKLTELNNIFQPTQSVDLRSLSNRELPNKLLALHYNGVLTNNWLVEGQYSKKDFAFVGGGAQTTDLIGGTLLRDIATFRRAWAPTFCGVCGNKERNNKDYLLKSTYFLSTKSLGNHSIVSGLDVFNDIRNENNQQSGSNFRIFGDFIYPAGASDIAFHVAPADSKGNIHSYIQYNPIKQLSVGSAFKTESAFINDKLDLNNKLSFNAGIRYDRNNSKDEQGVKRSQDSRISPRLGVIYDILGNGRHRASLNYGRYVAKLDSGVADSASQAGVPASIYYEYKGPEINAGTGPYLTTDQVIKQVFDWFAANGGVDNKSLIFYQSVPGVNTKFKGSLKSPYMDEISGGYGVQIGTGGYLRGDIIHRKWSDFYTTDKNLSTGTVTDELGNKFDLGLITNSDDSLKRTYNGGQLQASYRVGAGMFRRTTLGGNYTYSKLRGNVEGETSNNATVTTGEPTKFFPEYNNFAQNNPRGYLNEDVRHRVNAYLSYDLPTFVGNFNFSVLERYHSGQAYSAVANINQSKLITNPGYIKAPTASTYFFSDRGAFRLDSVRTTDLALNYTLPIKKLQIFVQGEMLNAENNDSVEDPRFIRTTVFTSASSSQLLPFNASTTVPVACTTFSASGSPTAACKAAGANFAIHPDFGKATSSSAYQLPRTYRVSFGVRF